MNEDQWRAFSEFAHRFKNKCEDWLDRAEKFEPGWLAGIERNAAREAGNPEYPLETPLVYNRALDDVRPDDEIKIILVGDNPGKDEQLKKNRKYLVGQAGKLGNGFFAKHPELAVDFRKNVIILNKTPIHTAKTNQLAKASKLGGPQFTALLEETQIWMARETAELQRRLQCSLWLVGYGELRGKGLFAAYARELSREYASGRAKDADRVALYQHFSMNRFSIDLADRYDDAKNLGENLSSIGRFHRNEILGW